MITKTRSVIKLLLLSTLMLVWTGSALAQRNIIVDSVTVAMSTLQQNGLLTFNDTILVRNGGTLFVNQDAAIGSLTIGDAFSAGNVVFQGNTPTVTLIVSNDVAFGPNAANFLDMTLAVAHTLKVGGNFLASGQGAIHSGASTIEYNNPTSQFVTAKIGGGGATIQYNNLNLSGGITNDAIKNFAQQVSVQGNLLITDRAIPSGGSVTYGPLATLVYNSGGAQRTTTTEWPAAPARVLTAAVIVQNGGLTLDTDKAIAAVFPYSLNITSGNLNDGGHTLTVQGNVNNLISTVLGSGKLVLGGNTAQTISGGGNYGNVTLANNATSTIPSSIAQPEPIFAGRLVINNGSKLKIVGNLHHAALLSLGNTDQPAGQYGSSSSSALPIGNRNDNYFDSSSSSILTVDVKPQPAQVSLSAQGGFSIDYGTPTLLLSGTVVPPTIPNFAAYGNGAVAGEPVSNVLYVGFPPVAPLQTLMTNNLVIDSTGSNYSLSLPTGTLPAGDYTLISFYAGGINLAAAESPHQHLAINQRHIGVIPNPGQSKVYGQADPVLGYQLTNTLVNGDQPSGALSRVGGPASPPPLENVGSYNIVNTGINPLTFGPNYVIDFTPNVPFNITPLQINVTIVSTNKSYGSPDSAVLNGGLNVNYTISPALVPGDTMSGNVTRLVGQIGETIGQYGIGKGTLVAGGNSGNNYNLVQVNNAFLTITPLTVEVHFNDFSKEYGSANGGNVNNQNPLFDPQFTYTYSPSLAFSDSFISNYSTNRDLGQTVAGSPYKIRLGTQLGQGNVVIAGGQGSNYNLTVYPLAGNLTITRKPVTVSANTPISKPYGAAITDPFFFVTYTGFLTAAQNGVPAQAQPTTPATLSFSPNQPLTTCTPASTTPYPFQITDIGSDPNYAFSPGSPLNGNVTVIPGPLTVMAANTTKPYDGNPFPTNNFGYQFGYPVNYTGLLTSCGDTVSNWFNSGTLTFVGPGATATNPGVYPITPSPLNSVTKYTVTYASGYVAITTPPGSTTNNNIVTWVGPSVVNGVSNQTFMINQANGGTAGANPGWNLLKINNTLQINASVSDPFRVDLVTLNALNGNQLGTMAKFDPTRPYSWEFVRATTINNFNANAFVFNWANLFLNPIFNQNPGSPIPPGTFSVSMATVVPGTSSLLINFTPIGSTGGGIIPVPANFEVGTNFTDPNFLLGSVYQSDVPMLWLQPGAGITMINGTNTIDPQTPTVTFALNVANLKGVPIIGVDAYINFSSSFFVATVNSPSGPQVAPGGGPWQQVITKVYNTGGDLDTVVAVSLNNTTGTASDGTVALITLTPTRTAVGVSRVMFRADNTPNAATPPTAGITITNDLVAFAGGQILPARVMTDQILIAGAATAPVISNIQAVQTQPHYGQVNVANGAFQSGTQVIATSGGISASTASGPLYVTLTATDAGGVGLVAAPTVVLTNGLLQMPMTCTNPAARSGTFGYTLSVPANTNQGTWVAVITATDSLASNPNITVDASLKVSINTYEVSGVVDLQSFMPGVTTSGVVLTSNRVVTFKAGGTAGTANSNQWNLNLNLISGPVLGAGQFLDTAYMASQTASPTNTVTTWTRFGSIPNLSGLVSRIKTPAGAGIYTNFASYMNRVYWGSFSNLFVVSSNLVFPLRNIDTYVDSQLSSATILALSSYLSSPTIANSNTLTPLLLNDFNTIVLGGNIYDPVRFAGVPVPAVVAPMSTVMTNRLLLADAYKSTNPSYGVPNYFPGFLNPQTAKQLFAFTTSDPTLVPLLLVDFDTLTTSPNMWPITSFTGTWPNWSGGTPNAFLFPQYSVHFYDQGIYNQTVFIGVPLSSATTTLLGAAQQTGFNLTQLNQSLLQDGLQGLFQKAPFAPQTCSFATNYPGSDGSFTTAITTDLNSLINSGTNIYNNNAGGIWTFVTNQLPAANYELNALLFQTPSPTAQQIIRMNRLLLEMAYTYLNPSTFVTVNALTTSELATFRLTQVPSTASQISAKTSWNLRVTKSVALSDTTRSVTLNLVSGGVQQAFNPSPPNADSYLRGGDIFPYPVGDNIVDLNDYNALRANWATAAGGQGDINGDGVVTNPDYSLLKANYGAKGDADVTN